MFCDGTGKQKVEAVEEQEEQPVKDPGCILNGKPLRKSRSLEVYSWEFNHGLAEADLRSSALSEKLLPLFGDCQGTGPIENHRNMSYKS